MPYYWQAGAHTIELTAKQFCCYNLFGGPRYRHASDVVPVLTRFQEWLDGEFIDNPDAYTFVRLEPDGDHDWTCGVWWAHHDGELPELLVTRNRIGDAVYKCVAEYFARRERLLSQRTENGQHALEIL